MYDIITLAIQVGKYERRGTLRVMESFGSVSYVIHELRLISVPICHGRQCAVNRQTVIVW